jgi:transposase-like zinc-binding protein
MRHIADCRTAALGGHLEECDSCGHRRISFNSCRDRHCPKCQSTAREAWIEAQLTKLLPVPYFHVVFTLPEQLNPLALANQKILFDILFATAASTLRKIAADPQHLGADIGFTAVLHTWGQNLLLNPHS